MIFPPSIARIHVIDDGKRAVNLWLPLILLWPLALALMTALAPMVLIIALCAPPYRRTLLLTGPYLFGLLCAVRGLHVNVKDDDTRVNIYFM